MWGEMMDEQRHIPKRHPEKVLTTVRVRNAEPGRHADGNGLYLIVDPNGARRWVLRTVVNGVRRDIGLGGCRLVSLSDARDEAARLRRIARDGGDPLAERRQERRIVPTFEECARKVHEGLTATFKSDKHKHNWIASLEMYVFPSLGSRPVDQIQSSDILGALSAIWANKPETAKRVRQRVRTVFDWCRVSGYCSSNPTDGITRALPKINIKQEHFASLPYAQVPEFIQGIDASEKIYISIKLAFEFLILTVARTSEVLLATWPEIDIEGKVWIIPKERMKAKIEHRVPLSARCIQILKTAKEFNSEFIFPGRSAGKPLSNMAFLMALRRLERTDITAHGFRSSFRNWAEEKTTVQRSVIEAALSHQVENKVEAAYLRTDLFDKRRRLMDSWATFATAKPAQKVVKIREA
jgi:integrase